MVTVTEDRNETVENIAKVRMKKKHGKEGGRGKSYFACYFRYVNISFFQFSLTDGNQVLNDDKVAAERLVEEVYREIELDWEQWQVPIGEAATLDQEIDQLGIWIDPIDATAEYVRAQDKVSYFF